MSIVGKDLATGKVIPVNVEPSDTTKVLEKTCSDSEGVPADAMQLINRGKELQPSASVTAAGIQKDQKLDESHQVRQGQLPACATEHLTSKVPVPAAASGRGAAQPLLEIPDKDRTVVHSSCSAVILFGCVIILLAALVHVLSQPYGGTFSNTSNSSNAPNVSTTRELQLQPNDFAALSLFVTEDELRTILSKPPEIQKQFRTIAAEAQHQLMAMSGNSKDWVTSDKDDWWHEKRLNGSLKVSSVRLPRVQIKEDSIQIKGWFRASYDFDVDMTLAYSCILYWCGWHHCAGTGIVISEFAAEVTLSGSNISVSTSVSKPPRVQGSHRCEHSSWLFWTRTMNLQAGSSGFNLLRQNLHAGLSRTVLGSQHWYRAGLSVDYYLQEVRYVRGSSACLKVAARVKLLGFGSYTPVPDLDLPPCSDAVDTSVKVSSNLLAALTWAELRNQTAQYQIMDATLLFRMEVPDVRWMSYGGRLDVEMKDGSFVGKCAQSEGSIFKFAFRSISAEAWLRAQGALLHLGVTNFSTENPHLKIDDPPLPMDNVHLNMLTNQVLTTSLPILNNRLSHIAMSIPYVQHHSYSEHIVSLTQHQFYLQLNETSEQMGNHESALFAISPAAYRNPFFLEELRSVVLADQSNASQALTDTPYSLYLPSVLWNLFISCCVYFFMKYVWAKAFAALLDSDVCGFLQATVDSIKMATHLVGNPFKKDCKDWKSVCSGMLCLGWVAMSFVFLAQCWKHASPFEVFANRANYEHFGLREPAFNIQDTMNTFEVWSSRGVEALHNFCWVVMLVAAYRVFSPSWITSNAWKEIYVLVMICGLLWIFVQLIGVPMSGFVGTQLTIMELADVDQHGLSTSILSEVVKAIDGNLQMHGNKLVSALFTMAFVSYVSALLTFMVQAMAYGIFSGGILFFARSSARVQNKQLTKAAACLVVYIEFLLAVVQVFPYTLLYQVSVQSSRNLWWISFFMSRCVVMPFVFHTVIMKARLWDSTNRILQCVLFMGCAMTLSNLWLLSLLWSYYSTNDVFARWRVITLPPCFIAPLVVCVGSISAIAIDLILQSHERDEELATLEKFVDFTRDRMFSQCIDMVLCHCLSWLQCPQCLKLENWCTGTLPMFSRMCECAGECAGKQEESKIKKCMKLKMNECLTFCSEQLPWKDVLTYILTWEAMTTWVYHSVKTLTIICDAHQVWTQWEACGVIFVSLACVWAAHLCLTRYGLVGGDSDSRQHQYKRIRYRGELLMVGIMHGSLVLIRDLVYYSRDNDSPQEKIRGVFARSNMTMPSNQQTIFDRPYEKYADSTREQLYFSWLTLALMCLARWLHSEDASTVSLKRSRLCSYIAGVTSTLQLIWPLKNNYASLVEFYFCEEAPLFEGAINAGMDNAIGLLASVGLGARLFVVLFMVPVSCVRTVWYMNLPSEDTGHVVQPTFARLGMGGHCKKCEGLTNDAYHFIMRHLLFIMVFLLPLFTAFPLLFMNQLAEDRTILKIHLEIWMYPSFFLFLCYDKCQEIWFYPAWVTGYMSLLVYLIAREMSNYNLSIDTLQRYLDIPYTLSSAHFEFCSSSVILSDALFACLFGDIDDKSIANSYCRCSCQSCEAAKNNTEAIER